MRSNKAKRNVRMGVKIILSFVLGQGAQLILHAACLDFWAQYQIPFCAAGGFLLTVAVFAGARIAYKDANDAGTKWEDMQ